MRFTPLFSSQLDWHTELPTARLHQKGVESDTCTPGQQLSHGVGLLEEVTARTWLVALLQHFSVCCNIQHGQRTACRRQSQLTVLLLTGQQVHTAHVVNVTGC
jgi:hypothetical protein